MKVTPHHFLLHRLCGAACLSTFMMHTLARGLGPYLNVSTHLHIPSNTCMCLCVCFFMFVLLLEAPGPQRCLGISAQHNTFMYSLVGPNAAGTLVDSNPNDTSRRRIPNSLVWMQPNSRLRRDSLPKNVGCMEKKKEGFAEAATPQWR